jgi:DNA-binding CsgD family transcriptional regulator
MASHLRMVVGAVPADVGIFCPVDEDGEIGAGMVWYGTTSRSIETQRREYVAHYRELDPFAPARVEHTRARVLTVQDLGGLEQLLRSDYGRFHRTAGYGDRAMMYLRAEGRITAIVNLVRDRSRRDFGPREIAFLRLAQRAFEVAYTAALDEPEAGALESVLTPRETEVAQLAAKGETNAAIALALGVTDATVKTHLARAFAKLEVHNRTQLAGLVNRPRPMVSRFGREDHVVRRLPPDQAVRRPQF